MLTWYTPTYDDKVENQNVILDSLEKYISKTYIICSDDTIYTLSSKTSFKNIDLKHKNHVGLGQKTI